MENTSKTMMLNNKSVHLEQEKSIHYSTQDEARTVDAEVKLNSEDKDSKVDKTFAASKVVNEDPIGNDDKAREELTVTYGLQPRRSMCSAQEY